MARTGGNPDIAKLAPKRGEARNPKGENQYTKGKPPPTLAERLAAAEKWLATETRKNVKEIAKEYDARMRPFALLVPEMLTEQLAVVQDTESDIPPTVRAQLVATIATHAAKFRELAEDKGPNLNVNFNLPPAREIASMLFGEQPPVLEVQGERLPALEQYQPPQVSAGDAIEPAVSLPHAGESSDSAE